MISVNSTPIQSNIIVVFSLLSLCLGHFQMLLSLVARLSPFVIVKIVVTELKLLHVKKYCACPRKIITSI